MDTRPFGDLRWGIILNPDDCDFLTNNGLDFGSVSIIIEILIESRA